MGIYGDFSGDLSKKKLGILYDINRKYPLVNIHIAMERSTIL